MNGNPNAHIEAFQASEELHTRMVMTWSFVCAASDSFMSTGTRLASVDNGSNPLAEPVSQLLKYYGNYPPSSNLFSKRVVENTNTAGDCLRENMEVVNEGDALIEDVSSRRATPKYTCNSCQIMFIIHPPANGEEIPPVMTFLCPSCIMHRDCSHCSERKHIDQFAMPDNEFPVCMECVQCKQH